MSKCHVNLADNWLCLLQVSAGGHGTGECSLTCESRGARIPKPPGWAVRQRAPEQPGPFRSRAGGRRLVAADSQHGVKRARHRGGADLSNVVHCMFAAHPVPTQAVSPPHILILRWFAMLQSVQTFGRKVSSVGRFVEVAVQKFCALHMCSACSLLTSASSHAENRCCCCVHQARKGPYQAER